MAEQARKPPTLEDFTAIVMRCISMAPRFREETRDGIECDCTIPSWQELEMRFGAQDLPLHVQFGARLGYMDPAQWSVETKSVTPCGIFQLLLYVGRSFHFDDLMARLLAAEILRCCSGDVSMFEWVLCNGEVRWAAENLCPDVTDAWNCCGF